MIRIITDYALGKVPLGAARSKEWAAVRREHLELSPACEVCGGTASLEVHHVAPFHVRPDLELDHGNLMTLCERKKFGINCHLLIGHLGNYRRFNPEVRADAATWCLKLTVQQPMP